MAQADRMTLLYNWPVAAPRYSEAESLFAESGDAKNALAARLEKANVDVKIDQHLLRLSPSVYNNQTDIDKLLNALS